MSELHILNVGRADCSILLLDTEEGRKTVVLDGGGVCFLGRRPLLEFLEARGIGEIDLLILTHLHQDHFGGFYQLIDRIFVKQLVAPCGDLVFCEKVYPVFGDDEYYREYHAAFRYFEQAGTELLRRIFFWGEQAAVPVPGGGRFHAVRDVREGIVPP